MATRRSTPAATTATGLPKAPTGIHGLDEITGGGLPRGRPTPVWSAAELTQNMRSLGFDLDKLQRQKKIALDHVRIERREIEETGEYDLEGLFIRLGHAIDTIGAKRVVLDTIEALFAGLPNHAIVRAELRRLFRWLKDRGMTAIITAECGENTLTRYGLEAAVA